VGLAKREAAQASDLNGSGERISIERIAVPRDVNFEVQH